MIQSPDDPVKPGTPKSIDFVLAEQANEAMQQGHDPHAATDMLGTMLRHLRANPSVAQQANDALAAGIDPHAIAGEIWRQSTAPQPPQKGVFARAGDILSETAKEFVQHPLDTTGRLIVTPLTAAYQAAIAPSVGEERHDPRLSKGGNSSGAPIGGTYDAAHGAVTPAQRTTAGLTAVTTLAAPSIAGATSRRLLAAGANRFVSNVGGGAAAGFAAGAASNPRDPFASGLAGATAGGVIGGVVPPVVQAGGKLTSSGVTALGLRPSGRTAAEMAADVAAARAPVGPQSGAASNTPTIDVAMKGATPAPANSTAPILPNLGQRVAAATGKAASAVVDDSKTLALRELARRFELDNVTPEDALAYAARAGNKPIAVLDLGGGNVAGLARTAKDVPSLARRQIPEFLNQRSAGTFGDEGQTLQRLTGDVQQRIGLAPENYYKTLDDMIAQQKALSKPAYDKVRDLEVSDPDVLELFNIPEFRFAHKAVADAERIRPNGAKIPPLSNGGAAMTWGEFLKENMGPAMQQYGSHAEAVRQLGEQWRARSSSVPQDPTLTVRDANDRLRSDLSKVSSAELEKEWARLAEMNATEEAMHGAVEDAGYREDYNALPSAEKTGRSRRTTDQFGNKIKRQAEDLPDADGMVDPERLAADNKIVSDYRKSIIVRRARQQAIDRIKAELDRRPPSDTEFGGEDTSFDFGRNALETKGLNPQTLGTLDKMRQYIGDVARGKLEGKGIDRNTARAMLERLDAVTQKMDALYPDYAKAREGYAGRAQAMDAYQAGKEDFLTKDPREIQATIAKLPESQADLYRRGGYDQLLFGRLRKMSDAANIGDFLEKNPDIRDRVAALAKNPDDAMAVRGDFNIERQMGQRRNFILGGPNTAERLIEHESTKPMVTKAGDVVRHVPILGKAVGGLVDNAVTRRTAGQTSDVMSEVGKLMTRTGRPGIELTLDDIARLRAADLSRRAFRDQIIRSLGAQSTSSQQVRQRR